MGEFEVIVQTVAAKHDAVKTFMVLETADYSEAQTRAIHGFRAVQIGDGAGNAEMILHWFLD